jgi:PAS domain S-box-containing protein
MKNVKDSISGKNGQVDRLKARILDLTVKLRETVKREGELRDQVAIYWDMLDTVKEGIVHATLSGKVISVNSSLESILGLPAASITGKNILVLTTELLAPGDAKVVIMLLKNILAGKEIPPFQVRYQDKILEIGTSINLKTRNLTGIIRDVTESKKIEGQLIKKNKDLSKLFAMSLHLLESLDRVKVLAYIVEHAASLVGSDTSAIYMVQDEGLYLTAAFPPLPEDFPEEFKAARLQHHPHINQAIKTGTVVVIPDVSHEKLSDEEQFIVATRNLGSLVYIPLFIQKRVKGVLILGTMGRKYNFEQHEMEMFSTFSHITSMALENSYLFDELRTTKERAEESNKLKTAFLHNISHEIRTPLNAIIGFSTILGQADLTAEVKEEYINIITQSNLQLLGIIEDIIDTSKIEAGQISVTESETDLNRLFKNLYGQYLVEAEKKGLEFHLITPFQDKPVWVVTDEKKVISILSNLLHNAFKFTHSGSIHIGCNLSHAGIDGYVSDTGIGIPDAEQNRIFDRFYQIERSSGTLYGGMGLGLSIAAAYLKALGGSISLDSSPGKGSRFSFTIPCKGRVSP